MDSDDELMLECMASLGITFDKHLHEELHQMATQALYSDPLQPIAVKLLSLLDAAEDKLTRVFLIQMFSLAVWQHGYRAAPKLEFVLPEGAGG